MRLLRLEGDCELSLVEVVSNIPRYAILSHTWGPDHEEVTFKDIKKGTGKSKAGYAKVHFCRKQAAKDNLRYFWVDTCCIDKSSSSELSEAINSMFRWYQNAERCYVYLPDVMVSTLDTDGLEWRLAFQKSRWFTRGWTLQELIAPASVEFFSEEETPIGDKLSLELTLREVTGIAIEALRGKPLHQFSVDERMSWATDRQTKREEDAAYCLLGIFDIHMPLLYGEGRKKSLMRLQREIEQSHRDETSILIPLLSKEVSMRSPRISSTQRSGRNPQFADKTPTLIARLHELIRQQQDHVAARLASLSTESPLLATITHTSLYEDWIRSGSVLWCSTSANLGLSINSTMAATLVKVSVASHGELCDIDTAVLYPEVASAAEAHAGNPGSKATPRRNALTLDLLRTLVLQSFVPYSETIGGLQSFIEKLPDNHRMTLGTIHEDFRTETSQSLIALIHCVRSNRNSPLIIAMDGAHVIAEQGCDDVFKVLIDLPTGRRASRRVHVIIGGEPSTALVKTLDGVPYVDMDTEYQECLESLYFEGQYTRQNQIAAAHSDTNGWIWTHPSYMAWEQDESSILWIEGKPGSGKSVLAKQIQTSLAKDQETYTCQWFFSTRGGHTLVAHTSFMRSILYQLLQQNRSFFQYFLNTYRACAPRTSLPWESLRSMQEILRNIIATGIRIQCIVDAMDEAEAGEDVHSRQKLLITLSDLVALPETSRFKIIVCSRPIHDIDVAFSRHQRLFGSVHKIVLQAENSGTISSTIDVGLTSLRDAMRFWGDNYVPPQAPDLKGPYQQKRPPKGLSRPERLSPFQEKQKRREDSMFKKIRSYLLVNAQGVVLWVTLILGVLESTIRKGMYTFSELEQRLKTLPIGLDGLYKYCIDEIRSNSGPEVVAKARRALMFVSGGNALKPLKLEELWEALATPLDIESALLSNEDPIAEGRAHITSWKEFRWQLHAMCGPLVEVVTLNTRANRPAYDDVCGTDTVQLLHRTVKDFLGSYDLAGALSFSEAEAAQFTEDAPNAYAHIVMPSKSTRYISLGSDKTGNWASNIENVVEYLSDKKLLPWIFDTIPNHPMEKARLLGIFSFLLDDCTYPPLKSWSEAKIEREFGQHVMTSSGLETAQSIVCAHFVHYACSNGFTVAVRVLMEILALDRTDYIMYACFDAALMVAIRHEMLDLVQAFTVHGRNEPECRFWEESMYNVKGMSFYLTSFEMAAAQSGNEAIVREVYDRNHRKEKQMPWDQWWYLSRGRKNWSRSPDDFRVLLEFTRECRVARQALEPLPSENVREAIQAIIDYGMCWGET